MALSVGINDLPSSVSNYSLEQLSNSYLILSKTTKISTIQIKRSHLPSDLNKIMGWNFWDESGIVEGISDVRTSTVKMILYSITNSKTNITAIENSTKEKNRLLIEKINEEILDLEKLNTTSDIESQINIKKLLIQKLEPKDESNQISPLQIGAIGRRVFDILKNADSTSLNLKREFEYANSKNKPNDENAKHKFEAGKKTSIYKDSGEFWKSTSTSKSNVQSDRSKPKDGIKSQKYVPPQSQLSNQSKYNPPDAQLEQKTYQSKDYIRNNRVNRVNQVNRVNRVNRVNQVNQDNNGFISIQQIEKFKVAEKDQFNFPNLVEDKTKPKTNSILSNLSKPTISKLSTTNAYSSLAWDDDKTKDLDQNKPRSFADLFKDKTDTQVVKPESVESIESIESKPKQITTKSNSYWNTKPKIKPILVFKRFGLNCLDSLCNSYNSNNLDYDNFMDKFEEIEQSDDLDHDDPYDYHYDDYYSDYVMD